jgi:hypothetical protein
MRLGLTALKGIVLGALLTVVVGGLGTASPGGDETPAVDDAYQRVVERAVSDQRCSFEGVGRPAPATSALIKTSSGNLRVVSFAKGWDVYTGKRPGRLVAVCLDDREQRLTS